MNLKSVRLNVYTLLILLVTLCFSASSLSNEKIRFVAENLPPFHFANPQNQPTGALVEVLQALIKQSSLNATIELLPFARSYAQTQKQPNVFMFSFLRTPSREKQFKWVGQMYKSEAYLVGLNSRDDIQINSLDSAKAYVVATVRGYYSEEFLKKAGFTTQLNLSLSVNNDQMWHMLFKKRIDLVLTNTIGLDHELLSAGLDPTALKQYIALHDFPNQLHIATGMTTSDKTVLRLRKALEKLKQSGQYQPIIDKWGL